MSQVVLPLTRVKVTRRVAVKTQVSHLDHLNATKKNVLIRSGSYIPSHSPSLSTILHPVSFVPGGLILVIIHCTLTARQSIKTISLKKRKKRRLHLIQISGPYLAVPLALIPLPCVRHTIFCTCVGSSPMTYTIIHLPLIGAAIQPGVGALAHGHVAHKFSLLD